MRKKEIDILALDVTMFGELEQSIHFFKLYIIVAF
jgi:hypothetical protein